MFNISFLTFFVNQLLSLGLFFGSRIGNLLAENIASTDESILLSNAFERHVQLLKDFIHETVYFDEEPLIWLAFQQFVHRIFPFHAKQFQCRHDSAPIPL